MNQSEVELFFSNTINLMTVPSIHFTASNNDLFWEDFVNLWLELLIDNKNQDALIESVEATIIEATEFYRSQSA